MKFLMIIIFVITNLYFAQSGNEFSYSKIDGFRETKWASNFDEVNEKESIQPIEIFTESNFKIAKYRGEILNKDAEYFYLFRNEMLAAGVYRFISTYIDSQANYLDDYEKFKEILTAQYGHPQLDEWQTNGNLSMMKDSKELTVKAIQVGTLKLRSEWISDEGKIILELGSGNGIANRIFYFSDIYKNAADESFAYEILKR